MGEEEQNKELAMNLIYTLDKRIPKLCTQVLFSLATDGKIVLTFLYRENPNEEGIVIERIMLTDNKQARQIIEKLNEVIKQSETIIQEKSTV
jgi:formylmethanofuran dehydrogenase subunit E